MNERRLRAGVYTLIFAVCLCTSITVAAPCGDYSDVGFRQSQTAITAYWMVKQGFHLAYETPVLGAPWSIPFEFPLYQAIAATVCAATGMPLRLAGAFTSLFFFYATLPLIYSLLGHLVSDPYKRLGLLGFVLMNPIYLFWPSTFLIESTALFFSFLFLWAAARFLDSRSPWMWGLGVVAGMLAGLVKITTFAVFLVAFGALAVVKGARRGTKDLRLAGAILCLFVLPVLVSMAWTSYADALKALNPLAADMTSTKLVNWTFGTLEQRLSLSAWSTLLNNSGVFPAFGSSKVADVDIYWLLPATMLLCALVRARAREAAACLLLFLAGPLLFMNLYFVHDYYFFANGVFLSLALGFIVIGADERCALRWKGRPHIYRMAPALLLTIVLLALQYMKYEDRYAARAASTLQPAYRAFIDAITSHTRESDVLLVYTGDWSSVIPYLAQRRAIMDVGALPLSSTTMQKALSNLGSARIGAMVIVGDRDRAFIEERLHRFNLQEYRDPTNAFEGAHLYFAAP